MSLNYISQIWWWLWKQKYFSCKLGKPSTSSIIGPYNCKYIQSEHSIISISYPYPYHERSLVGKVCFSNEILYKINFGFASQTKTLKNWTWFVWMKRWNWKRWWFCIHNNSEYKKKDKKETSSLYIKHSKWKMIVNTLHFDFPVPKNSTIRLFGSQYPMNMICW